MFFAACGLTGCVVIPPPIDSHYNRGVEFYDQGRLADAIDEYKLALRQSPADTFAKYNLAVAYQDQGKFDEALALYGDILRAVEDTNSRINTAAILFQTGREEPAFQELQKAAAANRDSPNPHSFMGELLERKERFAEAEARYSKALAIDGKHAPTWHRLGRLYLKQGKPADSINPLLKAVELDPKTPRYLQTLADAYERAGRPLEAIAMMERYSVLRPDDAEAYVRLGDMYTGRKFYKEAVTRYWTALSIPGGDHTHIHASLEEIFTHMTAEERQWLAGQHLNLAGRTSPSGDAGPAQ